jgi:POT family proton-dependent oligopeptide transporter
MKDLASWNEGDWVAAIATVALFAVLVIGGVLASRKSEEVVGHPRGLFVLFYTEMWERFSYYGMRALLILYLTKFWLYSDGKANLIYGAYTSLVYITPVLGGYLADRWLGQRKAVLFGGILLAFGHGLMAVEGAHGIADPLLKQADPAINVFWLALAFIIVGSGFLKANISVIVGQLYKLTDGRRDGAYSIFYMGVNVGAAMGTILVGYLGETIGWAYGFGLAGIGMIAGLIIFVIGKASLRGRGEPPALLAKPREFTLYGVGIVAVGALWLLIQYQDVVGTILLVSAVLLLGYTLFEAFKLPKEPRERIFAIIFLLAFQPIFWGLFEQAGGALSLFTDRFVDRGGVPTSLFQSINPIFIVTFAPLLTWLWRTLGAKGVEPSAPGKFGYGLVLVGLGFVSLIWGDSMAGEAKIGVIFIFLVYWLHTIGELCLSPVGLSAMNRLTPKHLASFIMGAWFFATAGGNFVAGLIGEATSGEGGQMTREKAVEVYGTIGWWVAGIGVVVILVAPFVKKLMHLDTLKDDDAQSEADRIFGSSELGEPEAAGIHPATKG